MADEQTKPPFSRPAIVPTVFDWPLSSPDGDELEVHYRHTSWSSASSPACSASSSARPRTNPGPGQAPAPDRRPHRQRALDDARRRREGRRLRGAAGEERRGHEGGSRPILHAPAADPGHRGRDAARAGDDDRDPAAAPAASSSPPTTTSSQISLDRDQKKLLRARRPARLGDRGQHRPALRHEPAPARHRHARRRQPVTVDDSLRADPSSDFDMVLTNPPFGKKSIVHGRQRGGRHETESMSYLARRLLGLDVATSS